MPHYEQAEVSRLKSIIGNRLLYVFFVFSNMTLVFNFPQYRDGLGHLLCFPRKMVESDSQTSIRRHVPFEKCPWKKGRDISKLKSRRKRQKIMRSNG